MMKRVLLVTLLLGTAVLAACGGGEPTAVPTPVPPTAAPVEETPDTAFDSPLDMANPASVFCEEQGYKLEIRQGEGGEAGYCIFDDGSSCEEWAFYRGECAPGDYP